MEKMRWAEVSESVSEREVGGYGNEEVGLLASFNNNEIIVPVHSSDLLASMYVHFCWHSNVTNQIYII